MPLKLTGGSITLSVAAITIVWTLRSLRYNRRRRNNPSLPLDSSSKYFAELSLETIALLVSLCMKQTCNLGAYKTACMIFGSGALPPTINTFRTSAQVVIAGSFYCCAIAVAPQVHLQPIPYYSIDVRTPEEAAAAPLAQWVTPAVNIPGDPLDIINAKALLCILPTPLHTTPPHGGGSDEMQLRRRRWHYTDFKQVKQECACTLSSDCRGLLSIPTGD